APNAMPTVAQPTPRFSPLARAISRYKASATRAAAGPQRTATVGARGRRRETTGCPASSCWAGPAATEISPKASTSAAITASATAVHGVLARLPEPDSPHSVLPGRTVRPGPLTGGADLPADGWVAGRIGLVPPPCPVRAPAVM